MSDYIPNLNNFTYTPPNPNSGPLKPLPFNPTSDVSKTQELGDQATENALSQTKDGIKNSAAMRAATTAFGAEMVTSNVNAGYWNLLKSASKNVKDMGQG
jgi:hypothetical protein